MLQQIFELLEENGEMTFEAFVGAAYAARIQPQLWLKAKHAGLVTTEIRDGVLYIRAVTPTEEQEG